MKNSLIILLSAIFLLMTGCGGHVTPPDCSPIGVLVAPPTATVSHAAAPPGNSQTFAASTKVPPIPACVASQTAVTVPSNWTVSDPSVHLSASPNTTATATCTAALGSPVTVTATATLATGQMLTGTATLTCN